MSPGMAAGDISFGDGGNTGVRGWRTGAVEGEERASTCKGARAKSTQALLAPCR